MSTESSQVHVPMSELSGVLLSELERHAEDADRLTAWPEASWDVVRRSGVLGMSIPRRYGGAELSPAERLNQMELLASGCLTTAFILSQREAAIRQLAKGPEHLCERYYPRLASDEAFLTVGLSQLTTSRQHQGPSLRATPLPSGGYRLQGEIPWVTGAEKATAIIVGATLADARQLILELRTDLPGVIIEPPLPLSSLAGSGTSLVRCNEVSTEADSVLAGPVESVMGRIGGGGLDTSCLALGTARSAQEFITGEAQRRLELNSIAAGFEESIRHARTRLHSLALGEPGPDEALALRVQCTNLALRTSQAALMVAKGAGFLVPHRAQRLARQALFYLVWSCPRPVADGVLAELTREPIGPCN